MPPFLSDLPTDLLLPGTVLVALPIGAVDESTLWPEEAQAVDRAVPARRAQFAAGRACARRALSALGLPAGPIPVGPDRAPCWPAGVVGSLSHSQTLAVALVAPADRYRSLGIDVEPSTPLSPELWKMISAPGEPVPPVGERGLAEKLRFGAKEAAFKCWFTAGGRRILDFDEMRLEVQPSGALRAFGPPPGPTAIDGRFASFRDHWWSVTWAPPSGTPR